MATCPMCGTVTEAAECSLCGFRFTAAAEQAPDPAPPADPAPGWAPVSAAPPAETPPAPPVDADEAALWALAESEPTPTDTEPAGGAPWDHPESLYRTTPVTPPPSPDPAPAPAAGWGAAGAQAGLTPGYPGGPGPDPYATPGRYPSGQYGAGPYTAGLPPRRNRLPLLIGAGVGAVALIVAGVLVVPRLLAQPASSASPLPRATTTSTAGTTTQAPVNPPVVPPATQGTTSQAGPVTTDAGRVKPPGETVGYFTVLDSLAKKWFTANEARAFADEMGRTRGRTLTVVDSDATGNMNPGYYVVGEGLSPSKPVGDTVCRAWGREPGGQSSDCYAKTVTLSDRSIVGSVVPETPAQICERVVPGQGQACTPVNDFLLRFSKVEKMIAAGEVGIWFTEPAFFYSRTMSTAEIQAEITAPTSPQNKFYPGHLLAFQQTGSGATATWIVPFTKSGKLGIGEVTYDLVPGTGANKYRIARVTDRVLIGPGS